MNREEIWVIYDCEGEIYEIIQDTIDGEQNDNMESGHANLLLDYLNSHEDDSCLTPYTMKHFIED